MSCFGEKRSANVSEFTISLKGGEKKKILAAVCRIEAAILLPSKVFEFLKNDSEETGWTNTSCKPVCLQNETGGENDVDRTGGVTNSGRITDGSHLFLLKVSETVDECLYDVSHISNSGIRDKVQTLIENYCPNKTETTALKMKIILSDEKPIAQRSRRLSLPEKRKVEKQIDEWLEQGIIRESCSDFSSPVVVCKKKDGTMRLCIDYRKLNKKIVKDRYPLPIIEEVLDKLGNGKIFTTLDLKNAFFHVDVDEASRKYTAFVTETGQYEFLKVPFGLSISSNYFQRYINYVFRELLRDCTLIIYLDDIIIAATDEKEACKKLARVLETAPRYGIELNLKKCQFLQGKINFLGHVIQNGIIQPSAEKTVSVCNFPEPKNAKDVQSFLGLTGYFRKYIPSYAMIARPLSDLLRGTNPFEFGHAQKVAFQNLKNALSSEPVLHLFKEGAKLELHTDACKLGLGAVLLQQSEDGRFYPIHYMSKKTSIQEDKLCSYELEVLAVIEALKKLRNYLLGRKFRIQTDCAAFARTLDKKELTPKMAKWSIFLTDFDYEVVHRPAKQMQHVDALSRHPVVLVTSDELTYKIVNAQESDEYIRNIKKLLQEGKTSEFIVCNKILYKISEDQELLVVPEMMQVDVIKKAHSFGHFAATKTEELVKRDYYFPNMRKCIENVVKNCVECILVNKKRGKGEGFLNPIPKEDLPLSTYHVDFIGPLPTTNKNYNHIFTVIDAFTKFTWLYPTKSTTAQEAIERLKLQQKTFGNPSRVISDKGGAFRSKEFEDYCADEQISNVQITTGVPRGNGQVERIHGVLIPVLTKMSIEDPTKWFKHVDSLQRVLNSVPPRSTKYSPFELLIGVKMKNPEDVMIRNLLEEESQEQLF
ncbi:transposon Tf2-8 polyprotein [Trichonephila clavipes]|nr:transposon Tf2-8 polyprotein [Trichonephila clavipes]